MEQIDKHSANHISAEEMLLLVDEQLASADKNRCQAHIEHCVECRSEYQLLVDIETVTRRLLGIEPSPDFVDAILLQCNVAKANSVQPLSGRAKQRPKVVWIGTISLLILGIVALSWNIDGGDSSSSSGWLIDTMASGISNVQIVWSFISSEVWSVLLVLALSFAILNIIDTEVSRRRWKQMV